MVEDVESSSLTMLPPQDNKVINVVKMQNGNSDHTNRKSNNFGDGDDDDDDDDGDGNFEPPDGGARAWLVMIGSLLCNGILFGVINSYGVLYAEFHDIFQMQGIENPSSKAALVGSLAMGATFFISPISGVLTDAIGLRMTTFIGGAIAAGGMFLSSFCVDNVIGLCITFGCMYGLGGALAYTPSLAILGHYFKRYLGAVNGVVTAGSSIFTIVMPFIMTTFLKKCGIVWTLRLLALIASSIMGIAVLFRPVNVKLSTKKRLKLKDAFNVDVWRNRKYVIWTLVIAGCLFGYFIPYVYMLKFVEANFQDNVDGRLPVLCIGITSGIGRLLFGYIADFPKTNRILLQQIALFSIGILTIMLPLSTTSFILLLAIALGMGLFDGCFISLLGPIAFDICGPEGATQAIGCLLGICSIPLTIGPYIAGEIYEKTQTYTIPFILAGIPPTIGSFVMFLTRCAGDDNTTAKSPKEATNKAMLPNGQHHHHHHHQSEIMDNQEEEGPV